jgi:thiamine biosynthesis lipoprotein ApbE
MALGFRRSWPCLLMVLALVACKDGSPPAGRRSRAWVEVHRTIFGGIPARVKLGLAASRRQEAGAIAAACWAELRRLGAVFNAVDPTSEIGRLNASPTVEPVAISRDLAAVLRVARRVHAASDGAFDPTLWPLKRLWRGWGGRRRPAAARPPRRSSAAPSPGSGSPARGSTATRRA